MNIIIWIWDDKTKKVIESQTVNCNNQTLEEVKDLVQYAVMDINENMNYM